MQNKLLTTQAIALFNEIDSSLEGNRYYTKAETKENRSNFVSAIIHKDADYLKEYYPLLELKQIEQIESLIK